MTVGVRPESLELAAPSDGIPATVSIVEELGAEAFVHALGTAAARAERGSPCHRTRRATRASAHGESIHLRVKDESMLFFDADSGDRLWRPGD